MITDKQIAYVQQRMSVWAYAENIVTVIAAVALSVFMVWWSNSLWGLLALLLLGNINFFRRP